MRGEVDGIPVAFKTLRAEWRDPASRRGAVYRSQFLREGRLLEQLDHP